MTTPSPLRLGTRASALATTQSTWVADRLRAAGLDVELVPVRTEGDTNRASLSVIGGTGVFAAVLRRAVREGEVDLAVHSLKDLPTAPEPGLVLAAVPEREDPRDVLVARDDLTLATLPTGARVGTGSPRRAAQLLLARPDLDVRDIRGNVDTRIGYVRGGELDAVVLARAGLARLGRLAEVTDTLEDDVMLPAAGQGALAVECREGDTGLAARLAEILDHPPTRREVDAERAVLAALEAGCTAPIGARARCGPTPGTGEDTGPTSSTVSLSVFVALDGRPVRHGATGEEPVALGHAVAEQLLLNRPDPVDPVDGGAPTAGEPSHGPDEPEQTP